MVSQTGYKIIQQAYPLIFIVNLVFKMAFWNTDLSTDYKDLDYEDQGPYVQSHSE